MDICMDIDYIRGYIKEAHLAGTVNFSEEEEKDFQALLRKDLDMYEELTDEELNRLNTYKEEIFDNCGLVVDWYDIEDVDYHWEDCLD